MSTASDERTTGNLVTTGQMAGGDPRLDKLVRRLPPAWVDWAAALAAGVRRFERMDPGGRGYFGWPAAARAETGRRVMALRGRLIATALPEDLARWPRTVRRRRRRDDGASGRPGGPPADGGSSPAYGRSRGRRPA